MSQRLRTGAGMTLVTLLMVGAVWALRGGQQTPVAPKPTAPTTPESTKPAATMPSTPKHALEKADLEAFFDGIVPLQLERSDVAGATVLVMKDGQALLKKGYGYADLKKKKAVDPDTTMFRLASISKLFTWISVMQMAERGKLDIDTDVNKYLDFQIAPAFGKPIVLRNLMTHTGGFEEEIRDIILADPKMAMPLRQFLVENQPRRMYAPGEVPAYSNYGVGLGGYVVQRVSGEPFEQYVAEHIFAPLGMKHSSFNEPLTPELAGFASEGYKNSTEAPVQGFEIFNPAPAGGISSTAGDMGRFAQALLNGGELDGKRILKPETLQAMWTRQFAASDALPAMCMGFYQFWRNGLQFVGHGGDLIAFHSVFAVEPREKLVLFVSYNSVNSENKARGEIINSFTDRYYPSAVATSAQKLPVEELARVAGTYQSTRRADSTKLKVASISDQVHASVDKDGVLKLDDFRDLRGHVKKWKATGKDLWQEDEGQDRLFVIRDGRGRVARLAFNFAGVQLERVPWYERDSIVMPVVGACLAIVVAVVAASLIRLGRRIFLRRRPMLVAQPGTVWLSVGPRLAAFLWIALAICTGVLMSLAQSETFLPTRAMDKYFVLINVIAGAAILLSVIAVLAAVRIWRRADVRVISRVKFSVVAVACVFLIWFSAHWNLIGPARRF
jgi:CubicO group peptidase (beta-lactamase class C family)